MARWNVAGIKAALIAELTPRVEAATQFIEQTVKRSLSEPWPPASRPGERPHLRTGFLQNSYDSTVDDDGLTGHTGSDLWYAKELELQMGRPHLQPALDENKDAIRKIMVTGESPESETIEGGRMIVAGSPEGNEGFSTAEEPEGPAMFNDEEIPF